MTGYMNPDGSELVGGLLPSGQGQALQFFQLHNADRQSPGGNAYGILVGATSGIITPDGLIDRQTETGFDQIGTGGVTTSAQQFAQQFLTSALTGNIAAGQSSAVITVVAPLGMVYKNALTIDSGANAEQVMIAAISGSNITIVPVNGTQQSPLAPAFKFNHSAPFSVSGFVLNQERDQNGELDIPRGQGMAVAMPMLSLSTGQGATSPVIAVRERGVQGLGSSLITAIASGFGAGSLGGVLGAAPVGLLPGMALYLTGGASGGFERVLTALNYVPGSATIILDPATPVQGQGRTSAQYVAFAPAGPMGAAFWPEGEGGEFQAGYDLTATSGPPGRFAQMATQNNAPYANSFLEALGLDNGTTLDRMAGNQNLALINAVNATAPIITLDQLNINASGVKVLVNMITAGSNSLIVAIRLKDPFGNYLTMLATAAIATPGMYVLTIYPGLPNVANQSLNDVLPRTWRVEANPFNANPMTYTVGAMTLVS